MGGFADCAQAASDSSHTIIDGSGGATDPVFRITGNMVSLVKPSFLTIKGGDEDGSGKGGGIYLKGNGILELNQCTITQNIAGPLLSRAKLHTPTVEFLPCADCFV